MSPRSGVSVSIRAVRRRLVSRIVELQRRTYAEKTVRWKEIGMMSIDKHREKIIPAKDGNSEGRNSDSSNISDGSTVGNQKRIV